MFLCYEEFEEFIAKRLGVLRSQNKISAREMSLDIGQGEAYINNIENKNNMPSMRGLFYICEFLKISPKDFFDDEIESPKLLLELMNESKRLDEKSLESLLSIVKNLKR